MPIRPLFNMCKIEIIDEYAGVIRNADQEQVQKGRLIEVSVGPEHLTASTGFTIDDGWWKNRLHELLGKVVHYAQYADSGQVIEEDGQKYAYVPFYRLIGVEED